jgi:hypothetical protein
MDRKKLAIRLVTLIIFIFLVNSAANTFYWYSSIWWFDMPMHFLGGFWIGLAMFWFLGRAEPSLGLILKGLLAVLVVGVGWEVFEIAVNSSLAQTPLSPLDIISDIFFDLAGGSLAVLYFFKRIRYNQGNV